MERFENCLMKYIDELIKRYPLLKACHNDILKGYAMLEQCFSEGGKLLVAGNGGSAADADHIVGELMKGFCLPRKVEKSFSDRLTAVPGIDKELASEMVSKLQGTLPAIALHNHGALNTAYSNDVDGKYVYAQQVYGYGEENDVFLGITTSGNSVNIISAAAVARAKGMKVLGLTGRDGGMLKKYTDICIRVDEAETYKVQELHLPVYHCLCLMLEERFFGNE